MKDMNILDPEINISFSMKEEDGDSLAGVADSIIEAMKQLNKMIRLGPLWE